MQKKGLFSVKSQKKGGEQMKRILILAAILTLVMAGAAFAGVSGTLHDLSGGTGQICVACHTPHGATAGNGPLWNRTVTSVTYTVYSSGSFDMGPATNPPGGQSLACLSCHNGSSSSLVNYPGPGSGPDATYDIASTDFNNSNANSLIGSDLSDDHPVGFTYNPGADQDNNGFPAINGNGDITGGVTGAQYPLYTNQFECSTCHDVHNISHPAREPVYFLRTANFGSNLCADCHVNKY